MSFRESMSGQGVMVNEYGPAMSGTWVNPSTGHKFTVADSFIQDGNFMVITTDGQTLDYNMLQHYIQTTDASGKEQDLGNLFKKTTTKEEIPSEIESMIEPESDLVDLLPEDAALINNQKVKIEPGHIAKPMAIDPDTEIINRVLKDLPLPSLGVSIEWPDRPDAQLKTLVDVLNIDASKIAQYYIGKIDKSLIVNHLIESIDEYISQVVGLQIVEDVQKTVETEMKAKPQPKAKPKKMSKKSNDDLVNQLADARVIKKHNKK